MPESAPSVDNEIEVSEEMIEAGVIELADYRHDRNNEADVVSSIESSNQR